VTDKPIGPYESQPAPFEEWDPRTVEVARRVAELVNSRRPDLAVDHIGSSAVPGLPGKNVVDVGIEADPQDIPQVARLLCDLGFEMTTGPRAFPPTRPLLIGSLEQDGRRFRIHAHVHPREHRVYGREHARDIAFRDTLRADPVLRDEYAARKNAIISSGTKGSIRYSMAKTEWIRGALERIGVADPPISPPATIGILGGGQLGRMLALAARELGFRIAVLDPDRDSPAAAVADGIVPGRYDDTEAALRLANDADVITYELEHVSLDLVQRLDWDWPVRPGVIALFTTQDRIEERRFLEAEGASVAQWRKVGDVDDLRAAAGELGLPLRLKAGRGGYDGRSQVRIVSEEDVDDALDRLRRPSDEIALAEREVEFEAELSVICARGVDGRAVTFPLARNRHDAGILVESVTPAGVPAEVEEQADRLVRQLAEGLDLVGTLTAELFLMPGGELLVNELAPRVHNSGHWSIEGTIISQFEQHVRAITGLPLGPTTLRAGAAATVNLLGTGREREARPAGVDRALREADVHVHLYDKRRVFERRKMGHVTAVAATPEEALAKARAAAAKIEWEDR
jgi:5-(carboxyamino)imidazole ribonucleotide synthase